MTLPYSAADLRERIDIVRYDESVSGTDGTVSRTAVTIAAGVRALVRPMTGNERDRAQQMEARANYLVVVRHRDDVTHAMYVRWKGREMNIRFPKHRGRRERWLEMECELNAP